MNIFSQSTGCMELSNGIIANGYAGRGEGKDNPAMEGIKGIGPLPVGHYRAVELFEVHPTVGKYALRLEPDAETKAKIVAYGRDPESFFCHGDAIEHPGLASHGCIVQQRPVREYIWNQDRDVEVLQ